jgi:hypothetical protein
MGPQQLCAGRGGGEPPWLWARLESLGVSSAIQQPLDKTHVGRGVLAFQLDGRAAAKQLLGCLGTCQAAATDTCHATPIPVVADTSQRLDSVNLRIARVHRVCQMLSSWLNPEPPARQQQQLLLVSCVVSRQSSVARLVLFFSAPFLRRSSLHCDHQSAPDQFNHGLPTALASPTDHPWTAT